jgi:hypothetical protein
MKLSGNGGAQLELFDKRGRSSCSRRIELPETARNPEAGACNGGVVLDFFIAGG